MNNPERRTMSKNEYYILKDGCTDPSVHPFFWMHRWIQKNGCTDGSVHPSFCEVRKIMSQNAKNLKRMMKEILKVLLKK